MASSSPWCPAHLILLAGDNVKKLADEETKGVLDQTGQLTKITKQKDPADADREYIGATLIEVGAAGPLTDALEATGRRDPNLYYEDSYQECADRGGEIKTVPIGAVNWVEVDNHTDLEWAREVACRY